MSGAEYDFALEFSVRDYECDLQGVVNNAVYLNYLEHCRHEYLKTLGLDFARLHQQGYDLVVTRCELDYRSSLRSGECFVVRLQACQESLLRFAFVQTIHRLPNEDLVLNGKIIGTCLSGGRPSFPAAIKQAFGLDSPEQRAKKTPYRTQSKT